MFPALFNTAPSATYAFVNFLNVMVSLPAPALTAPLADTLPVTSWMEVVSTAITRISPLLPVVMFAPLPIHALVLLLNVSTFTDPVAATVPLAAPLMTQLRIFWEDLAPTKTPVCFVTLDVEFT